MKLIRYLTFILLIPILNSCGFRSYKEYSLSNTTDDYGNKKVFIDSSLNILIRLAAYSSMDNISLTFRPDLIGQKQFILDTIQTKVTIYSRRKTILNNLRVNRYSVNSVVKKLNYRSIDTTLIFNSFKDIPLKFKIFRNTDTLIYYDLDYSTDTNKLILNEANFIRADINIKYRYDQEIQEKTTTLILKANRRRYFWFLRDC